MTRPFLLLLLGAALSLAGAAHAAPTTPKDGIPRHTEVRLIPEFNAVKAGDTLTIAIDQNLNAGWHTYWKNPGDSGETTSIEWSGVDGLVADDIEFPEPHKIDTGPLSNFGFSGHNVFLQTLHVPDTLPAGDVTLTAHVTWLVCEEICVPEELTQTIPVTILDPDAPTPVATDSAFFAAARDAIPALMPWQGMIEEMEKNIIISLRPDDETGKALAKATAVYFYPEEWGVILNPPPQIISVVDGEVRIKMQRDTRPLSDLKSLKGVLTYSVGDAAARPVALDIALASSPDLAMAAGAPYGDVVTNDEGGGTEEDEELPLPDEPVSLAQALTLAVLGGLILNLMPCVFPVLSLKALSLIKMSAKEQKHAVLHGVLYTAGVLICFGAIAVTLLILKSAGAEIGWGFQMQNPVVVLLLAYLLFAMAANMSGFFEIGGGMLGNIGHKLTAHHGYAATFFTGILAVLVATPCTAPFMGTALGFALTQPNSIAVGIFLALGLGLALPYLLLCLVPALRHVLPKPGVWMETFRELMAFPLYASVAWLIWVYAQQVSGLYGVFTGLIGIVLIAFSIWIIRKKSHRIATKLFKYGALLFALFFAISIAFLSDMKEVKDTVNGGANSGENLSYTPYSPDNLTRLLAGDNPVFVDMTAAWCITCKVNEQVALETDETRALFTDYHVQYVVGDWTNRDGSITKYLKDYGRSGVPLYVYYGARDPATKVRPEPVVLPQLLTSGLVADVIEGQPHN